MSVALKSRRQRHERHQLCMQKIRKYDAKLAHCDARSERNEFNRLKNRRNHWSDALQGAMQSNHYQVLNDAVQLFSTLETPSKHTAEYHHHRQDVVNSQLAIATSLVDVVRHNVAVGVEFDAIQDKLVEACNAVVSWETLGDEITRALFDSIRLVLRADDDTRVAFMQRLVHTWIVRQESVQKPMHWMADTVEEWKNEHRDLFDMFLDETLGNGVIDGFDRLFRTHSLRVSDPTIDVSPFRALHLAVRGNNMSFESARALALEYLRALRDEQPDSSTLQRLVEEVGTPLLEVLVMSGEWTKMVSNNKEQQMLQSVRRYAADDEEDKATVAYVERLLQETA